MKNLKILLTVFLLICILSGCMVAPAMYAVMGVKQHERAQGRAEEVDFVYAKDRVVIGVTTKADITKNLGEPNLVTQDANEVWKYEHRVVYGFGDKNQGDFTQVFVVFKDDLVVAISGSELLRKKEVKFAKGDTRLLPLMALQPGSSIVVQPASEPSLANPANSPSTQAVPTPVAKEPASEIAPVISTKKAKVVKPRIKNAAPTSAKQM